ncbi:hypothetical protein FB479_11641 [Brevibacillus sp. AG162]|uniref:DUF6906 family protein n=1 Tax=Brevibacillus sp. AG162 TaxID=2572910 RepID=UPI00116EFE27|nr:hypothetical protein [Brevibacillus sp. AG162]TQK41940.1 hypothetical protein FB479_11641 [Brevibacillus sp. AG162]
MKKRKRPTARQKHEIEQRKLNPENWFVERDNSEVFVIIHRVSGKKRTFKKGA